MIDIDTIALLAASTKLDLHGLTCAEAEFELIRTLNLVDTNVRAVEVVHGYHNGRALKTLVRQQFAHPLIAKKIPLDASRTLLALDFSKINQK